MMARRFFLPREPWWPGSTPPVFPPEKSRHRGLCHAAPLLVFSRHGAGSKLSGSRRNGRGRVDYFNIFFPGPWLSVCLFTAIFSTISVIEDRQAGFLQAVLVSPAPRGAIVMGKMVGGTLLAIIQAVVFIALMPVVGVPLTLWGVFWATVLLVLLSFGLTGLGLVIAWTTDSIQGFHAIMNLLLMPIWFLSGAVFPVAGAPGWLKVLMLANPVTYGVAGLQLAFFDPRRRPFPGGLCGCEPAFAGAMFLGSWLLVRRTRAV